MSSWHHEPACYHLDAGRILCWLPCSDAEHRAVTLETAKSHTLRMVPREVLLPIPSHVLVSRQKGARQQACAMEARLESQPAMSACPPSALAGHCRPASLGRPACTFSARMWHSHDCNTTCLQPLTCPALLQSPAPAFCDTCRAWHGLGLLCSLPAVACLYVMRKPSLVPHQPPATSVFALQKPSLALCFCICTLVVLGNLRAGDQAAEELFYIYYQPLIPVTIMIWLWGTVVRYFERNTVKYDVCFPARDQKFLLSSRQVFQVGANSCLGSAVRPSCCEQQTLWGSTVWPPSHGKQTL